MSKKSGYSTHHKLAQKWKKDLVHPEDINDKRNKVLLPNNVHTHIHWKDGADTPAMVCMNDVIFNIDIFKKQFVKDIIDVFEKHMGNYYIYETMIQEEIGRLFELEKAFNKRKKGDD